MEISHQNSGSITTLCEWCFNIGTSRCGRCHSVFYCSRQHQVAHWSIHKKVCNKSASSLVESPVIIPTTNTSRNVPIDNFQEAWGHNDLDQNVTIMAPEVVLRPTNVFTFDPTIVAPERTVDFPLISDDEIFSSFDNDLLSSDNNFWDIINPCDAQNIFESGALSEKDKAIAKISKSLKEATSAFSNSNQSESNQEKPNLMQCASLHDICANIVHDLNAYGICVLDNFIGSKLGSLILGEVKNLYCRGIFRKGELVSSNLEKENIRSDVTTWVNGTEPDCFHIGSLIQKLDVVLTTCNKLRNSGVLSKYKLHRRTKAMIACYPGDGTYYKKHIDNPHKDGRCITCIYYLNKNWDVEQNGGLLRMFPSLHDSQVANIEPIFDRMLFFWSDKRNPHEVLPAYATRFAITVWYFDADERDQALLMTREKSQMHSRNPHFVN